MSTPNRLDCVVCGDPIAPEDEFRTGHTSLACGFDCWGGCVCDDHYHEDCHERFEASKVKPLSFHDAAARTPVEAEGSEGRTVGVLVYWPAKLGERAKRKDGSFGRRRSGGGAQAKIRTSSGAYVSVPPGRVKRLPTNP